MTAEPQPVRQQLPLAGRLLVRVLQVIAGVIGGAICFFGCEDMFAHYPQYATGVLTVIGIFLIAGTGGVAWIIDHRRIDAGGAPETDGRLDDGN